MKEAMGDLASGKATVLSQVSAPYRISNVSSMWKEFFGLEEAESVGRSIKVRRKKLSSPPDGSLGLMIVL